jgi:hypothetical protein
MADLGTIGGVAQTQAPSNYTAAVARVRTEPGAQRLAPSPAQSYITLALDYGAIGGDATMTNRRLGDSAIREPAWEDD